MSQPHPGTKYISQSPKTRRDLIEGRPALIVIDIQAETSHDRTDEAQVASLRAMENFQSDRTNAA
jgi:hypothetical protein